MATISCFDWTAPTLDANLAIDEALLLAAEAGEGPECLRTWEWPALAVVLGAGGAVEIDVAEAECAAAGVPLHRRASGGGTVLLGPGCLMFSIVLAYARAPELRDVNASYRWILGRLCAALEPLPVALAGTSDLALDGLKFSGNAQQRKARHVLHHGTMLYNFDLSAIGRFLHAPEREPAYRAGRPHAAFVANLPLGRDALVGALRQAFEAEPGEIPTAARVGAPALVRDRYGLAEWVRRR